LHRVAKEQEAAFPNRHVDVAQEGDVTGDWDIDRLGQVASNLIGNALQHGGDSQPVRVTLDGTDADRVVLSVRNRGVIPPEVLPHLFDPFRGGQRAGRAEGLGLGLYIVQQIVHAHGGRVDVQSAPDTHTLFRVTVPRRAPSA
jgi:two-component system sensor histidine kinase/response regulator